MDLKKNKFFVHLSRNPPYCKKNNSQALQISGQVKAIKDHTSFLAFGRSKRIFSANRSWVEFFTQTLDLEKTIQSEIINVTVKTNLTSLFFENCILIKSISRCIRTNVPPQLAGGEAEKHLTHFSQASALEPPAS